MILTTRLAGIVCAGASAVAMIAAVASAAPSPRLISSDVHGRPILLARMTVTATALPRDGIAAKESRTVADE